MAHLRATVSKDGHKHGASCHPSRRSALRAELLRMTLNLFHATYAAMNSFHFFTR